MVISPCGEILSWPNNGGRCHGAKSTAEASTDRQWLYRCFGRGATGVFWQTGMKWPWSGRFDQGEFHAEHDSRSESDLYVQGYYEHRPNLEKKVV